MSEMLSYDYHMIWWRYLYMLYVYIVAAKIHWYWEFCWGKPSVTCYSVERGEQGPPFYSVTCYSVERGEQGPPCYSVTCYSVERCEQGPPCYSVSGCRWGMWRILWCGRPRPPPCWLTSCCGTCRPMCTGTRRARSKTVRNGSLCRGWDNILLGLVVIIITDTKYHWYCDIIAYQ